MRFPFSEKRIERARRIFAVFVWCAGPWFGVLGWRLSESGPAEISARRTVELAVTGDGRPRVHRAKGQHESFSDGTPRYRKQICVFDFRSAMAASVMCGSTSIPSFAAYAFHRKIAKCLHDRNSLTPGKDKPWLINENLRRNSRGGRGWRRKRHRPGAGLGAWWPRRADTSSSPMSAKMPPLMPRRR